MIAISLRAQQGKPFALRTKSLIADLTWMVTIRARAAVTIISTALSYGGSTSTAAITTMEMNMHTQPGLHFAPIAKAMKAKIRRAQMVWIASVEPNTAPKTDVIGRKAIRKRTTKINI